MVTAASVVRGALARVGYVRPVAAATRAYEWRGAAVKLRESDADEILLSGPAGTGKSLACLAYLHETMLTYAGARALIVRKVRADLAQSALVTFEQGVLGEDNPICASVQRPYRQVYVYPNGSEVVVGGMDRPTKVMSAEYDLIYVQEAIELDENDWESLTTRLRNGKTPRQQLIADTNPSSPDHWLKLRCDRGQTLLFYSVHEDNPRFYQHGTWTADGVRYMAKLDALTRVRKERLRFGRWVQTEGAIYEEWRDDVHVVASFEIPPQWKRFLAIDFGYTHPFVCQWWAVDPDGRMYLYREIYKTQRLVEDHAADIARLSAGERIAYAVCDHDAEGRATFERHSRIRAVPAKKAVLDGIQAVQGRLRVQGDGKPRLMIFRDALVEVDEDLADAKKPTCTRAEMGGYVWENKTKKEQPVKEDDHGADCLRYSVMAEEKGTSKPSMGAAKAKGLWEKR